MRYFVRACGWFLVTFVILLIAALTLVGRPS